MPGSCAALRKRLNIPCHRAHCDRNLQRHEPIEDLQLSVCCVFVLRIIQDYSRISFKSSPIPCDYAPPPAKSTRTLVLQPLQGGPYGPAFITIPSYHRDSSGMVEGALLPLLLYTGCIGDLCSTSTSTSTTPSQGYRANCPIRSSQTTTHQRSPQIGSRLRNSATSFDLTLCGYSPIPPCRPYHGTGSPHLARAVSKRGCIHFPSWYDLRLSVLLGCLSQYTVSSFLVSVFLVSHWHSRRPCRGCSSATALLGWGSTRRREFQDGKLSLIIATSVGEEGLDFPQCPFVFYFDMPTPPAYIQSLGYVLYSD